ncbi:unnamed protein product, partial [Staurois parvus]
MRAHSFEWTPVPRDKQGRSLCTTLEIAARTETETTSTVCDIQCGRHGIRVNGTCPRVPHSSVWVVRLQVFVQVPHSSVWVVRLQVFVRVPHSSVWVVRLQVFVRVPHSSVWVVRHRVFVRVPQPHHPHRCEPNVK